MKNRNDWKNLVVRREHLEVGNRHVYSDDSEDVCLSFLRVQPSSQQQSMGHT
jgi:hypothetical protein